MAARISTSPSLSKATPATTMPPPSATVTSHNPTAHPIHPAHATPRNHSVRISVPLDAVLAATTSPSPPIATSTPTPGPLRRRDSLERREALLKGKEGTRQRRRWENAHLLNNPYAQPPLPSDYTVAPTHPVRTVPYYLAPLWDAAEFQRAVESKLHGRKNSRTIFRRKREGGAGYGYGYGGMSPMEIAAVNVPKEIRGKLKWKKGEWARGLLGDIEGDVRMWVGGWNEREMERLKRLEDGRDEAATGNSQQKRGEVLLSDTEDDEIVFVGRSGSSTSLPLRTRSKADLKDEKESRQRQKMEQQEREETVSESKLVYEGLENDKSASFARWLVHCVGSYYGLRTWSVTREVMIEGEKGGESRKEVRRETYVGIDNRARGFMGRGEWAGRDLELPRPLLGMV